MYRYMYNKIHTLCCDILFYQHMVWIIVFLCSDLKSSFIVPCGACRQFLIEVSREETYMYSRSQCFLLLKVIQRWNRSMLLSMTTFVIKIIETQLMYPYVEILLMLFNSGFFCVSWLFFALLAARFKVLMFSYFTVW